jgi:hypothetical protein
MVGMHNQKLPSGISPAHLLIWLWDICIGSCLIPRVVILDWIFLKVISSSGIQGPMDFPPWMLVTPVSQQGRDSSSLSLSPTQMVLLPFFNGQLQLLLSPYSYEWENSEHSLPSVTKACSKKVLLNAYFPSSHCMQRNLKVLKRYFCARVQWSGGEGKCYTFNFWLRWRPQFKASHW